MVGRRAGRSGVPAASARCIRVDTGPRARPEGGRGRAAARPCRRRRPRILAHPVGLARARRAGGAPHAGGARGRGARADEALHAGRGCGRAGSRPVTRRARPSPPRPRRPAQAGSSHARAQAGERAPTTLEPRAPTPPRLTRAPRRRRAPSPPSRAPPPRRAPRPPPPPPRPWRGGRAARMGRRPRRRRGGAAGVGTSRGGRRPARAAGATAGGRARGRCGRPGCRPGAWGAGVGRGRRWPPPLGAAPRHLPPTPPHPKLGRQHGRVRCPRDVGQHEVGGRGRDGGEPRARRGGEAEHGPDVGRGQRHVVGLRERERGRGPGCRGGRARGRGVLGWGRGSGREAPP